MGFKCRSWLGLFKVCSIAMAFLAYLALVRLTHLSGVGGFGSSFDIFIDSFLFSPGILCALTSSISVLMIRRWQEVPIYLLLTLGVVGTHAFIVYVTMHSNYSYVYLWFASELAMMIVLVQVFRYVLRVERSR